MSARTPRETPRTRTERNLDKAREVIYLLETRTKSAEAQLAAARAATKGLATALETHLPTLENIADQAVTMNLRAMKDVKPGTEAAIACQELRAALTAYRAARGGGG